MITVKHSGARKLLGSASRAGISYGMNVGVNSGQHGATVSAEAPGGRRVFVYLSSDEIDRMIAARDSYHRETAHRGYPVKDIG